MNHLINFTFFWVPFIALLLLCTSLTVISARSVPNKQEPAEPEGTKWALLVAGSAGYDDYRHQSDICHAYQILKRGDLKDENIIVFMYDDIAYNEENPFPGKIFNKPNGPNVYPGVPKDYTGDATSAKNFLAVLNGNRNATKGGSGKVLDSGPNDTVFLYYADHGAPGLIGTGDGGFLTAKDLIDALKEKHAANCYKKMVIYLEACESGSMFEGILPDDINIYATTAANAKEPSWAFYCRKKYGGRGYGTCLGDHYSISWMEDSDRHDSRKETLARQYKTVRERTKRHDYMSSHVMQYGDLSISSNFLSTFLGHKHDNDDDDQTFNILTTNDAIDHSEEEQELVSQRDVKLFYLRNKLENAVNGSSDKLQAQKELDAEIASREHFDKSVHLIGNHLLGDVEKSSNVMVHVRPAGQPLVDDWECFKTMINTYENHCGKLSSYGRKYSRAFANMCNGGISEKQMVEASMRVCPGKN